MTLWIGKIGQGVSDQQMTQLFEFIGGLLTWKRPVDVRNGQTKSFGFAEFASPVYALLAQKYLIDIQLGDSRLLVKADEKTQKLIDDFSLYHSKILPPDAYQKKLVENIKGFANEVNSSLGVQPIAKPTANETEHVKKILSELPVKIIVSEESNNGEITIKDKNQLRMEEIKKRELNRKIELIEEENSRESKRLEKEEKIYQRLEVELEQDLKDLIEESEKRKKIEEKRRLARIEDIEMDNKDSEEWVKQICSNERIKYRKKEKEQDMIDYNEELTLKRQNERDSRNKNSDSNNSTKNQINDSNSLENNKNNLNSVNLTSNNSNPSSTNETNLINLIPSNTSSLFSMTINWDIVYKNNLIEIKIKPWISQKIIEYLEEEEKDLINFICQHLNQRKSAQELIAQLKPVLDDETEVFVVKLWRLLIHESLKLGI